ncbi:MAG TPA: AbrB/MazE/SpoVT family DNA-binding domain-containing protein [Patescibacteria group bacterium]|nr:AbrB/MazE/SpoVT family DNA-binding domain-containing protein [Patescibacteria group bacterium]
MNQSATITSKMQLTIPMFIARKAGVMSGDKLAVSEENGRIILTPLRQLVEELAGSIAMPEKWKGKDIDEIIKEAKTEYFRNKKV